MFSTIRVLVDKKNIKFLVLGSASRDLIKQSAETLAGRIGYIEITPFNLPEVAEFDKLWLRGGFPLSYLANNEEQSFLWRQNYIKTFLERDIPQLGFSIPSIQLRKFWLMICHYHGSIFNASALGNSLGISQHTAERYLNILEGTFMIRILPPWYENLKKRQVKSPKIYFRDSGIYHAFLGLNNHDSITLSPKIGMSWEGFALEQIINHYNAEKEECYFWSSHNIAEIDLLIIKNGKRIGFEFKYTSTPKITKSIMIASNDLKLDEVKIIFPGDMLLKLSENIEAIGLSLIPQRLNNILELNIIVDDFYRYIPPDSNIHDEDRWYIKKCLEDIKLRKELYIQKKVVDRDLWKLDCILISHELYSPFYRSNFDKKPVGINFVSQLFKKYKINDNDVSYGMAIIFQDNTQYFHENSKVGMNVVMKLFLKNGEEVKGEWSIAHSGY